MVQPNLKSVGLELLDIGAFYGEHYGTLVAETEQFKTLDSKLGLKSKVLVAAGYASDGYMRIQAVYLAAQDELSTKTLLTCISTRIVSPLSCYVPQCESIVML